MTICARCARIIGENDDSDNVSQGVKVILVHKILLTSHYNVTLLFCLLVTSSDFNSGVFDDITKKSQGNLLC